MDEKPWLVMRDSSGWHRAVKAPAGGLGAEVVDRADTYLEACKIADKLNVIREVQED